jgi:hypothetical protein
MGLVDGLSSLVEWHPDTSDAQHSSLVQTVLRMFGNRVRFLN